MKNTEVQYDEEINLAAWFMSYSFRPPARYLKKVKGKRKMQQKRALPYKHQLGRFRGLSSRSMTKGGGTFVWDRSAQNREHCGGTVIKPVRDN